MKKSKEEKNNLAILGGLMSLVGVVLLATANGWLGLDAHNIWPMYLILVGLVILGLLTGKSTPAQKSIAVLFGSLLILLGGFFFKITLGLFAWTDMDLLWPAFILIPGLALICAYLSSNRRYHFLLLGGGAFALTGAALMIALQLAGPHLAMDKLWPIFVIAAGLLLVVLAQKHKK